MNRTLARVTTGCALALCAHAASAQFSSGSTGALGALDLGPNTTHNFTVPPGGVLNYTTVRIRSNTTVRYFRNSNNDPLVILATGDVTIEGTSGIGGGGTIIVSGGDNSYNGATPAPGGAGGPGGFDGGTGGLGGTLLVAASAGKGPGGGAAASLSGARALAGAYGAPQSFGLIPLFGGSGGGGAPSNTGLNVGGPSGGGGGGAILIASSTRITINGAIRANGGGAQSGGGGGAPAPCGSVPAPGSGGAIRLVAPVITGGGQESILQAVPGAIQGAGGPCAPVITAANYGRIRLEGNTQNFVGFTDPTPTKVDAPGPVSPLGNPALANVPTLAIAQIGGQPVPGTPGASYSNPDVTLAPGATTVPVVLNATNMPLNSGTEVAVRLMPRGIAASTVTVPASAFTGTPAASSATVNLSLTAGQVTVIQASAAMSLTGQSASLFPLIDGEPVARVVVAASMGEASRVSLVTSSGREVPLEQLGLEDRVRVAQAWETVKNTRTE
jgi:hypothetical protein